MLQSNKIMSKSHSQMLLESGLNDQDKVHVGRTFGVEGVAGEKGLRCECQEYGSTYQYCVWYFALGKCSVNVDHN